MKIWPGLAVAGAGGFVFLNMLVGTVVLIAAGVVWMIEENE